MTAMIFSTVSQNMGQITATLTVTNWVDEVFAERGFIPNDQAQSLTLVNVLVALSKKCDRRFQLCYKRINAMAESLNDFQAQLSESLDGGWDHRVVEFDYQGK
jgi:hypothetical protein